MKGELCIGSATCLLLTLLLGSVAWAYEQPLGLNLGFTSFMDGAPPAGPGFYFTEYISYYTANELMNAPLPPGTDVDIDVWVSLNQFIYQSNTPILFGGKWGLDVIVPLVSINSEPLPDNGAGLGDVLVGPYLQWDPIMGEKGPIFMHRIELQTIWPTGKYDDEDALNPGSNFFSFDPYWAATFFFTPQWTASWRVHYLWNAENDDPALPFTGADETQAGQAFHVNFATSYELVPQKLRLGLNGYYFDQVTDSTVNDDEISEDERVLALGPGALVSFSQNTHLFLNAYFETEAASRPEGERFVVRLVHHF
jgi:hypothetical protein